MFELNQSLEQSNPHTEIITVNGYTFKVTVYDDHTLDPANLQDVHGFMWSDTHTERYHAFAEATEVNEFEGRCWRAWSDDPDAVVRDLGIQIAQDTRPVPLTITEGQIIVFYRRIPTVAPSRRAALQAHIDEALRMVEADTPQDEVIDYLLSFEFKPKQTRSVTVDRQFSYRSTVTTITTRRNGKARKYTPVHLSPSSAERWERMLNKLSFKPEFEFDGEEINVSLRADQYADGSAL